MAPATVIACCLVMSCLAFSPLPQRQTFRSTSQRYARKDPADSKETRPEESSHLVSTDEDSVQNNIVSSLLIEKNPLRVADQVNQIMSAPWVEVGSIFLVLVSSVLTAVGTLSLSQYWKVTIENVEDAIAYAFALEFVARWYSSQTGFWGYLGKPLVLVDVVVVILPLVLPMMPGMPSWLTSQSGLINLRLLRILRVQRVLEDMDTFSSFAAALGLPGLKEIQPYQLQLARVVLSIFTLLSVNAGLIYTAEHGVNPDIQNYFSALYFGLTTLTTVGFGDITPVTLQGKLVVSGSILAGVTIIPAQAALLVEALLASSQTHSQKERSNQSKPPPTNNMLPSSAIDAITPCPSCGATFHWTSASYCWSCGSKL
jgi:voltage-gated potassium channel